MTEETAGSSVQALTEEIDRTRAQLGETVEALAAKADVKARARDKAAEVTGHVASAADQLREQAAARASQVRDGLADKVTGARRTVAASGDKVRQQVAGQAADAGSAARQAAPEPVLRAASRAAEIGRQRRVAVAVAAAAAGITLAGWLFARHGRRERS
jgi:hypothetical protein